MTVEDTPGQQRLTRQLEFLLAVDALKRVSRASRITADNTAGGRRENSAEHSWHVALFARVLAEHANADVDVERVVTMLQIHDIVEIDVGDTPLHAEQDPHKSAKEAAAARRLFALLPADQGASMEAIWTEFESGNTNEARFARALDRLQPMLLNAHNDGGTWPEFAVTREQLYSRTGHIAEGSETLWSFCESMIDKAVAEGWVIEDPT